MEVGNRVRIESVYLALQDKWLRERWGGEEAVILRINGRWADVRSSKLNEELTVPLEALQKVKGTG